MNHWCIQPKELFQSPFLSIRKEVYKDDPCTHSENPALLQWMFSAQNPYTAHITTSLWGVDSTCRIAGFYNPTLRIDGETAAFFGYWETHNHLQANQEMFKHFEQWAKRQGAIRVYGPINMTTYGSYRIQLQHQKRRPFFGEPYNPSYYPKLLQQCGYSIHKKYISIIGDGDHLPIFARKAPAMREKLKLSGLRATTLTPELWMKRQEEIHSIFQTLWQHNFGYVPIDFGTFQTFFSRSTAEQLDPHCSVAILDKEDKVAAYLAVYPDYAPLLNTISSSPSFARDFISLTSPTLLLKTGCVHPKYRKKRLFTTLSLIACEEALLRGYKKTIGCLIRSDNHPKRMDDFAKRINPDIVSRIQEYGLFTKPL